MDKVKMTYKVNKGRNPQTGAMILVPRVTRKPKMTLKQLVSFAKDSGYVRGQLKDLEGLLNGFIEAMKNRAEAGYTVNVNDWFIISGDLAGTVGEDRQLSSANSYHVNIRTSKALQVGIENFSWSREDEAAIMRIESLTSPNGNKGEVTADKDIVAIGRNVIFNKENGDTAKYIYIDDVTGEPIELDVDPSEKSGTYLRFDKIAALEAARPDSLLKLVITAHDETGAVQTATQTAKLIASHGPVLPRIVKAKSTQLGADDKIKLYNDTIAVTMARKLGETVNAGIRVVNAESGEELGRIVMKDGNTFSVTGDKTVDVTIVRNNSPEPDASWEAAENAVEVFVEDENGLASRRLAR